MRCFGWSADYVRTKITSAQGWAYYNWAMENEMTAFGALYQRKTPGYIQQEIQQRHE
jgi:hypothetical protein